MFELSANIEYMFTEAGESLESRIAAAAEAGISKVEMFTLDQRDAASIAKCLKEHSVEMWSLVNNPRTILADRNNHPSFLDDFRRSAEFAVAIGCENIVCGSGTGLPFIPRKPSLDAVCEAVASAAEIAKEYQLTVLLEAVNARVDHPGVLFSNTSDAFYVVEQVNSPNVKVLYDLYHSVAEGESPDQVLPSIIHRIGHVQIADFPGRGEPGSGDLDWPAQLQLLRENGYDGVIGVECHPTLPKTSEALAYIKSIL